MNAQDKAEARAAIERAEKLLEDVKRIPYDFRSDGFHYSIYKEFPRLTEHLKAALARIDELENEKKHLAAQVLFRLGIGE